MPDVNAIVEYLQDLPLYKHEKPYWCFLPPQEDFNPDEDRVDNLEFEDRTVTITDLRDFQSAPQLDQHGFEVLAHTTRLANFDSVELIKAYRAETEVILKDILGATFVKCYDSRLRKNITFERNQYDLNDLLHMEGPARGAHNDITIVSGPEITARYLEDWEQKTFLKPGYRVRIINTWRSLLPVLEDNPLALCDSRSVREEDLVPADRIIPNAVGEVYYLKYNPSHKWHWLSRQTDSELFVFVMYDTKDGPHGRFCPHVSFKNANAALDARPRESIETRSVVITKM